MAEGMLTQEEIDALLSGTSFGEPGQPAGGSTKAAQPVAARPAPVAMPTAGIAPDQVRSLDARLRSALGPAAEVASTLVGRQLSLTPVGVNSVDDAGLVATMDPESVSFEFEISGYARGGAAFVLSGRDAAFFADIMMGGDGTSPPAVLDDLHQTAAKEALSSLANGFTSALSRELPGGVNAGPLSVRMDPGTNPPYSGRGNRIQATYNFSIEGVHSGMLHFVMESSLASALAGAAQPGMVAPMGVGPKMSGGTPAKTVNVQQVQFPALAPTLTEAQTKNIEILVDVPMQVAVELGRTTMMIRDVLELGTGSIIELDKLAGEPVDLLVNQKLIARGEVVVIDESFGVRVTDIISPIERVKHQS